MIENIGKLFEYLIEKDGVRLFYTQSKSVFDSLCEAATEVSLAGFFSI